MPPGWLTCTLQELRTAREAPPEYQEDKPDVRHSADDQVQAEVAALCEEVRARDEELGHRAEMLAALETKVAEKDDALRSCAEKATKKQEMITVRLPQHFDAHLRLAHSPPPACFSAYFISLVALVLVPLLSSTTTRLLPVLRTSLWFKTFLGCIAVHDMGRSAMFCIGTTATYERLSRNFARTQWLCSFDSF